MRFKKGDVVRCINNADAQWDLVLGRLYVVDCVLGTGNVCVNDSSGIAWVDTRFQLDPLNLYGASDDTTAIEV